MWLDSERESLSESEKSSSCQSLHSSWDSSLDLEVRSRRKTEETAVVGSLREAARRRLVGCSPVSL